MRIKDRYIDAIIENIHENIAGCIRNYNRCIAENDREGELIYRGMEVAYEDILHQLEDAKND